MTPQTFKNSWTNTRIPLNPLNREKLTQFNLQAATIEFLSTAGLPEFTEADLDFVVQTDGDSFDTIMKLPELYSSYDFDESEIKNWIVM